MVALPRPAGDRSLWIVVLLLCASSVQSAQILLGYLYIQSPSSWVQESFSQFKLAVMDVNADSNLLPNHTLSFTVADSQGQELVALQGCGELLAAGVHAIVGTGYSSALGAPAMCASQQQKPIVSPGSDANSLIDKSRYPFLLRTLPNAASQLGAMAVLIYEMGWRKAASLTTSTHELDAIQVLQPALKALGVDTLTLFYDGSSSRGQQELNSTLSLVRQSGYHVIVLNGRTVDTGILHHYSSAKGLIGSRYCWLLMFQTFEGPWTTAPNVVIFAQKAVVHNPVRDAFLARWPSVTTLYDESIHGAWDADTKMPFFGNNTYSNVVYDTDYAPVGDGTPDVWGIVVYDTVWMLAKAFHALLEAGHSIDDGVALREALLNTHHLGVSGNKSFSRGTQDGTVDLDVRITNGSGPAVRAASTTALLGAGGIGDGSWCLSGCLDTDLSQAHLPWAGGGPPGDGRALDPENSEGVVGVVFQEGTRIDVTVSARDSFGRPCCVDTCQGDRSSSICEVCRRELAAFDQLTLRALDPEQRIVEPAEPFNVTVDESAARIVITAPAGFAGATSEDRDLSLELRHRGEVIQFAGMDAKLIHLESRACQVGSAGADSACTKCLPGSVAPTRGLQSCLNCTIGRFQDQTGQSSCKDCKHGFYTDEEGVASCLACEPGKYQPLQGETACDACPEPMTTVGSGHVNSESCVCPQEMYMHQPSGTCKQCPIGMECKVGSDAGAFGDPEKTVPQVLPGFWSEHSNPLSVFVCLHGSRQCPGGPPESCGRNLFGTVCAACQEHHYEGGGECIRCASPLFSKLLFPVFPVIVSLILVYPAQYFSSGVQNEEAWNSPHKSLPQLLQICLAELQIAGILMKSNLDAKPDERTWSRINEPLSLVMPECGGVRSFKATMLLKLALPMWCFTAFIIAAMESKVLSRLWSRARLNFDSLFGKFGSVFMAFYTAICAISMDMFKCYRHPNGNFSMRTAADVLCYESGEWMAMVIFSIVAIFFYCLSSLVLFMYILREAPRRTRDEVFCRRWYFLLSKFRAKERWWVVVWLLKGILLNLTQVVTSDGQSQLILLQLILAIYLSATLFFRPWRHEDANYFDALAHVVPLFVCALLFDYTPRGQRWGGRFALVNLLLAFPVMVGFLLSAQRLYTRFCLADATETAAEEADDSVQGARSSTPGKIMKRTTSIVRVSSNRERQDTLKALFMNFGNLAETEATAILRLLPEQDRKTLLSILALVSDVQKLDIARKAQNRDSGSESEGPIEKLGLAKSDPKDNWEPSCDREATEVVECDPTEELDSHCRPNPNKMQL